MQGKSIALLSRAITLFTKLEEEFKAQVIDRSQVIAEGEKLWVDAWALDDPDLSKALYNMWEKLFDVVESSKLTRRNDPNYLKVQIGRIFKQYHETEDWGLIMMNPTYSEYARWYFSFMYSQTCSGFPH
ncbi:MAG: hypothetical protein P4L77_10690 [Sulfuriferula sp.]|nr:hypothetical protein [Sulfuriferula sp.]